MEQRLENIITGCMGNNPASQRQLYQYCFEQMMRVCLRYHQNTDDAAVSYNEAMYKVFTKIGQYKKEGEFMGWVRRIMVNTCLNAIKQHTRFTAVTVSEEQGQQAYVSPDVYSQLQSQDILQCVQMLPRSSALVFNLYVMEGYTHEQIAAQLSISAGTSKWHLNNARELLKEKIKSMQQNETVKNAR